MKSVAPLWTRAAGFVVRRLPAGRYRVARWFVRPGVHFVAHLPPAFGSLAFECDLGDDIAREVWLTGQYEPIQTAIVRASLRPGNTFVDVGANWGYFSLMAAHRVGSNGRVIAVEPDPRLYGALAANVARNSLSNVTRLSIAAAAVAGTAPLHGFRQGDGNRGVSSLLGGHASGPSFTVRTAPLDGLLDSLGIDLVDLVKIDVEGAEGLALTGMVDGLRRHRYKRVLVEMHPRALAGIGSSPGHAAQGMRDAGYRGWWIDHSLEARRTAAYARAVELKAYLRPWSEGEPADAWPHALWIAPGVEVAS